MSDVKRYSRGTFINWTWTAIGQDAVYTVRCWVRCSVYSPILRVQVMVLLDHRASQMSAFRRMSDMMRLAITTFYSVFPANSGTVLSNRLHDFKCPFQIIFVLLGVRRLAYKISSYTRMGWQYVTEDPNKRDCIEYKSPLIGKFLPVRENGCSYSAKTETSRLCKILRLLNKSKGRTERKQNGVKQERKKR